MDLWLREYEEAKALASDILAMVQVDPVSELKGTPSYRLQPHHGQDYTQSSGWRRACRNAT